MRIKDTEQVQEVTKDLMIPVGNTDTDDARHITLSDIKDFTNEQVQQGLDYLGDNLDTLTIAVNEINNNTEVWSFELESGETINKKILIQK